MASEVPKRDYDPYRAPGVQDAAASPQTTVFSRQGLVASVAIVVRQVINDVWALLIGVRVFERETVLDVSPLVHGLAFLLVLIGGVAFLAWQYHVVLNLRRFARVGLTWSPAQSVVLWFIPILNLVHGYRVVSEVWRASDPKQAGQDSDDWKTNPTPPIVGWWWAFYLGMLFLDWALRGSPSMAALLLDRVLVAVAAILTVLVIRKVDARHASFAASREAWMAKLERRRAKAKRKVAAAP
jgi:hypothetical protein